MTGNNQMKSVMDLLELRRSQAKYQSEKKKMAIYQEIPRLTEIEQAIAVSGMVLFEDQIKGISPKDAQEKYDRRIKELEKERDSILESVGLALSDFEPKYVCENCRDTGFVNGEKCQCLKKMIAKTFLSDFDMTSKMKEACFDAFDVSIFSEAHQTRARKTKVFGLRYCEAFQDEGNYLFTGKAGRGKTFLCSCIAVKLIEAGYHVIYITAAHLADLFRNHAFSENRDETGHLFDSLRACDLLIIDDFGAEYQTDFAQKALFDIINTRLLNDQKMIISTNLSMEEMADQYDVRLTSRLRGNFKQLIFPWEDIRVKKSK